MCPELWTRPLNIVAPNENTTEPADSATDGTVPCPECDGTGADDMDGTRPLKCTSCDGTGWTPSSSCPPSCAPGIKCDHCSTSANSAPRELPNAEEENPAKPLGHFTARQALVYFDPDFFDEAACREWVISRLHPGGPACPGCGLKLDDDKSFRAGKRCHCGRCGRWFTATTRTILEGTHLDFAQVYALALFIELGIPATRTASMLGISADTVRLWMKKFRMFSND